MSETVTVIAHARAKPGKESEAREILLALLAPTRSESGCINYDLHQSVDDPSFFVFYENWINAEALDAHSRSEHIMRFRKMGSDVLVGPPVISKWKPLP